MKSGVVVVGGGGGCQAGDSHGICAAAEAVGTASSYLYVCVIDMLEEYHVKLVGDLK